MRSVARSLKSSRDQSVQAVMPRVKEQTRYGGREGVWLQKYGGREGVLGDAARRHAGETEARSTLAGIGRGEQQSADAGCRAQRRKVWLGADVRTGR